jgi:translation initiation factor 3 subunit C
VQKGDWKKSSELLLSLRIFNHHKNAEIIRQVITVKVKETCLKCYLILYSSQFTSLALDSLSKMFELAEPIVLYTVNSMILSNELPAKWNDRVLELEKIDNNMKIIKRLEENINTITQQNLTLIEVVNIK